MVSRFSLDALVRHANVASTTSDFSIGVMI
jgi:hypothetical protein